MIACCGPCVAATNCDTRLLTSITEPPAAPALVLLAIETGVVEVAVLLVLTALAALLVVMALAPRA
jgi:hypothetical protein